MQKNPGTAVIFKNNNSSNNENCVYWSRNLWWSGGVSFKLLYLGRAEFAVVSEMLISCCGNRSLAKKPSREQTKSLHRIWISLPDIKITRFLFKWNNWLPWKWHVSEPVGNCMLLFPYCLFRRERMLFLPYSLSFSSL